MIGRFLTPDSLVPQPGNPIAFDRYSGMLNNSIRYIDPSGHWTCEGESNCKEIVKYWLETLKKSGDVGRGVWEAFQERDKYLKSISTDQRGILIHLGNLGDYDGGIVILGRINIGEAYYKNYKEKNNVAVFAHEFTHYNQGLLTSVSTIGEMDAYQVQYKVLMELKGSDPFLEKLNKYWHPEKFEPSYVEQSRSEMNKQFESTLYQIEPYFPVNWLALPIYLLQNNMAYPLNVNSADHFAKLSQNSTTP